MADDRIAVVTLSRDDDGFAAAWHAGATWDHPTPLSALREVGEALNMEHGFPECEPRPRLRHRRLLWRALHGGSGVLGWNPRAKRASKQERSGG